MVRYRKCDVNYIRKNVVQSTTKVTYRGLFEVVIGRYGGLCISYLC